MSEFESVDLPNLDAIGDDPKLAQQALNKLNADPRFRKAYYEAGNHPQFADVHESVTALHKVIHRDGDGRPALEQAMEQGLEQQQQAQAGLVERGQKVMQELADLNFQADEIPGDISEPEVWGLETQALAAQGKTDEVITAISRRLEQNPRLPDSIRQNLGLWKEMTETAEAGEWADKLLLLALREIVAAERGRLGLKPRAGKKNSNEDNDDTVGKE